MKEALKLALEALQFALHVGFDESSESQIKKGTKAGQKHRQAITAIKEALAAPVQELDEYDAGLLNDYGGGNVEWWQDYIRYELGCAYEHYKEQLTTPPAQPAPVQELYIAPGLSTLTHSDNCRYWDDSEFCTCGAAEYHELSYWKTKALAAQPTQDLSRLKPFIHGLGQAILQELMTTPPAAQPAQEPHNFCPRCGKRLEGVLGQLQVHTCTPPLWGHK